MGKNDSSSLYKTKKVKKKFKTFKVFRQRGKEPWEEEWDERLRLFKHTIGEFPSSRFHMGVDEYGGKYQVGAGGQGKVMLAFDDECGRNVAIKVIPVPQKPSKDDLRKDKKEGKDYLAYFLFKLQRIENEIFFLKRGDGSNTSVGFHGAWYNSWEQNVYIAMQLAEGDLCSIDWLKLNPARLELTLKYVSRAILKQLLALHVVKFAHCDIKPPNVLYTKNSVMLTDYGLVAPEARPDLMISGTYLFQAPEVLDRRIPDLTVKIDLYSVGITLLRLIKDPQVLNPDKTYCTQNRPHTLDSSVKDSFSVDFIQFLETLLIHDPQSRPPTQELLNHPYLADCPETLAMETIIGAQKTKNGIHQSLDPSSKHEKESKQIVTSMGVWKGSDESDNVIFSTVDLS